MTTDQVNVLNIGLMVAACAAAFVVPFELFLIAYAVLGPLHYLTQIAWLHTRGYFTTGPHDYLLLGGLCIALLALRYAVTDMDVTAWATTVVGLALGAAIAFGHLTRPLARAAALVGVFVLAQQLGRLETAQVIFLVFMPTIIHVFLFTAAFILHGALRGRSATGVASLGVFVACAASFFLVVPDARGYVVSGYVRTTYELFATLNTELASWLGLAPLSRLDDVFASDGGVALMRFIAFAYTYHYLNWFSKTSVIQWHRIPRPWAIANVVLWIASIGLYVWDYALGLAVLFSLSWLHVILEFPLDHRTFVGIGRELGLRVRPLAAAPARSR